MNEGLMENAIRINADDISSRIVVIIHHVPKLLWFRWWIALKLFSLAGTIARCQVVVSDTEVTPEMARAGASRLEDLAGCAGPTYVAEEVFIAMMQARGA